MTKQLLTDTRPVKMSLEESEDGRIVARGEFGRCDLPTQNGRIYPRAIYEREVNRLNENIGRRRCLGELDHPQDGKTKLNRVSHVITDLSVDEDGRVVGEAEILDTPAGKTLKAIMMAGVEVGVSSRGFGSTRQTSEGKQMVGEDFRLSTFDFVADPAMKSAYPDIFTEDVDVEIDCKDLETSFPELVEGIREDERQRAVDATNKAVQDALSVREEHLKADLEERFARNLADAMVQIREDVTTSVRNELLEDPQVGGARSLLEHIATLVGEFKANDDLEERAKQDAMTAKDNEIVRLRDELENAINIIESSKVALNVADAFGGKPWFDRIQEGLGDLSEYSSPESALLAATALNEDLTLEHQRSEDERVEQLRESLNAATARAEEMGEQAKNAEDRLSEAYASIEDAMDAYDKIKDELAEAKQANRSLSKANKQLELQVERLNGAMGSTNVEDLLEELDGLDDVDQIRNRARRSRRSTMTDARLERIRNSVRRGKTAAKEATLQESVGEDTESRGIHGLDFGRWRHLAGIKQD